MATSPRKTNSDGTETKLDGTRRDERQGNRPQAGDGNSGNTNEKKSHPVNDEGDIG